MDLRFVFVAVVAVIFFDQIGADEKDQTDLPPECAAMIQEDDAGLDKLPPLQTGALSNIVRLIKECDKKYDKLSPWKRYRRCAKEQAEWKAAKMIDPLNDWVKNLPPGAPKIAGKIIYGIAAAVYEPCGYIAILC